MKYRNPHIARALFWDAAILLALSAYELFVRLDASWGWAKGYFLSHIEAQTPIAVVMKYIPYHNVSVWAYMLACALLALWALFSRRTRRVCAMMLAPAAALTAIGFLLRLTIFGEVLRTLKLLPLAGFTALCLLHTVIRPPRRQETPIDTLPLRRHRRSQRRRAA
ncbi:MAG: hypothetical protein IJ157_02665 [Clostridia bacterium]|nr:hypothetical protein [Clostridia bacterium]